MSENSCYRFCLFHNKSEALRLPLHPIKPVSDWRCTGYRPFPLHKCMRTSSIGMIQYHQKKRKLTSLWSALIKEEALNQLKHSSSSPVIFHSTWFTPLFKQSHCPASRSRVFSNTDKDSHLSDDDNSTQSWWAKKAGFDWSLKKEGLELRTNLPPSHLCTIPFALHHCTVGKSPFALQCSFNNLWYTLLHAVALILSFHSCLYPASSIFITDLNKSLPLSR